MPVPDVSTIPNWVSQVASGAGVFVVAGLLQFFERRKRKKRREEDDDAGIEPDPHGPAAQVLAGSIVDTRAIKEASEGLAAVGAVIRSFKEQQHDDSRALRQAIEDMTQAVIRNTAAQSQGAVSPQDMLAVLARIPK